MEYKPLVAPFKFGLLFLGILSFGLSVLAIWANNLTTLLIIVLVWAFLIFYIRYTRIFITEKTIKYQGMFRKWELKIKDIEKMERMYKKGWPFDRIYNYETWEFRTKDKIVIVNLTMFAKASLEIQSRIKTINSELKKRKTGNQGASAV